MIEVQHLTKRFVGRTAVDDLSFEVGKGEVVGFLGPNGAGKSTTMRMLTGYLPATMGTARAVASSAESTPSAAAEMLRAVPSA